MKYIEKYFDPIFNSIVRYLIPLSFVPFYLLSVEYSLYLYTLSKYFLLIDKKEYLPYEGFLSLFFIFFLVRDIQIRLIIFVRHSKI